MDSVISGSNKSYFIPIVIYVCIQTNFRKFDSDQFFPLEGMRRKFGKGVVKMSRHENISKFSNKDNCLLKMKKVTLFLRKYFIIIFVSIFFKMNLPP